MKIARAVMLIALSGSPQPFLLSHLPITELPSVTTPFATFGKVPQEARMTVNEHIHSVITFIVVACVKQHIE